MQHGGQEVDEEKPHHRTIDIDDIRDAHIKNAHQEANPHYQRNVDDLRNADASRMRPLHADHFEEALLAYQHKLRKD